MKIVNGFFKMPNWIFKYQLSPVTFYVYSYLRKCDNRQNGCYPSKRTIAADCGIAVSSVSKALDILEKQGLIEREHHYCEGRQTNNSYLLLETGTKSSS